MADLDYSLEISTSSGWLALEDEANGYTLGEETAAEIATSRRDRTVAGQWVEGSFTTASVKENQVVPVTVWVIGADPAEFDQRKAVLEAAFDQLSYQIREIFGGMTRVWTCMAAPYTVACSGPMRFAREGLVSAQVPRLPTQSVSYV